MLTPSRHQEDEVKRTSLFNEKGDEISGNVPSEKQTTPACAMEIDLSEKQKEVISETEEEIPCTPPVTEEKSEIPDPLTPPEETEKIYNKKKISKNHNRSFLIKNLESKCG